MSSELVASKLEQVEARLARLEQVMGVVAEAGKASLQAIADSGQRIAALETAATASYARRYLEQASEIFPKDRTVIFSGREYFGDNVKYAFLSFYKKARDQGIACWFLTDREEQYNQVSAAGLPCLPWASQQWTGEHIRILLSAKVVVLCNIFCPVDERGYLLHSLLRGARFIQLWHGIPLKRIGMECIYPSGAYRPRIAEVLAASGMFEVLVAGSASTREEWMRRFAFRDYAPIGWPRNDVLFRDADEFELINVDRQALSVLHTARQQNKSVILYAPTFRDHKPGTWIENAGIQDLAAHCTAQGWMLCVNIHPLEAPFVEPFRKMYPQIMFIQSATDIYPLLGYVSMLVTDYSSLAFDYLLLDRPIIYYRPDHRDYVGHSRALIPNADDYVCGPVVETMQDLTAALNAAANDAEPYKTLRATLRKKLFDHPDGNSGPRLNELIIEQLAA